MPFPFSFHGAVSAPRADERPHLLGGLETALRREGARQICVDGDLLQFRVKWLATGGTSVLTAADSGQVRTRVGPEGPMLEYEVSVRRSVILGTGLCFVGLGGGALLLGVSSIVAVAFAAVAWILLVGATYVTSASGFARFLRQLALDPGPPVA